MAADSDSREIGSMTMDVFPDDVLLHVFDCYLAHPSRVESWHTLVHVCRRWRSLVFGSPRRLNLRIACTNKMRVKDKLNFWPAFPIVLSGYCDSPSGLDHNIEAALKHKDRICQIKFVSVWYITRVFAALEKPFPALTNLELWSIDDDAPPVFLSPVKFLGGSSRLRSLELGGITIPGLSNLLMYLTDLVELRIDLTCESEYGFPSPKEIIAGVSALTKLNLFSLQFQFDTPRERESQHVPPARAVLPALSSFTFKGVSEYLEDLVDLIDAPELDHLDIALYSFNQVIFDTTQLLRFINRTAKLHIPIKHISDLTIPKSGSNFLQQHKHRTKSSLWESYACLGIRNFRAWLSSVVHHFSPCLRWNPSTSAAVDIVNEIGSIISRTPNG